MYTKAISLLALAGVAQAHMSLWYPGPLGGAKEANKASTDSDVDPELNFLLAAVTAKATPLRRALAYVEATSTSSTRRMLRSHGSLAKMPTFSFLTTHTLLTHLVVPTTVVLARSVSPLIAARRGKLQLLTMATALSEVRMAPGGPDIRLQGSDWYA